MLHIPNVPNWGDGSGLKMIKRFYGLKYTWVGDRTIG